MAEVSVEGDNGDWGVGQRDVVGKTIGTIEALRKTTLECRSGKDALFGGEREVDGKVVNVVDGDTFDVNMVLVDGWEPMQFRVRLAVCNTPETRRCSDEEKARGEESKRRVADVLLNRVVRLRLCGQGNFGRLLVRVRVDETIPDLDTWLMANGLATVYKRSRGSKKQRQAARRKQASQVQE